MKVKEKPYDQITATKGSVRGLHKKQVQIAGVNLTIDPSLPTFEDDAFIAEKTRRANLKFSNKG